MSLLKLEKSSDQSKERPFVRKDFVAILAKLRSAIYDSPEFVAAEKRYSDAIARRDVLLDEYRLLGDKIATFRSPPADLTDRYYQIGLDLDEVEPIAKSAAEEIESLRLKSKSSLDAQIYLFRKEAALEMQVICDQVEQWCQYQREIRSVFFDLGDFGIPELSHHSMIYYIKGWVAQTLGLPAR